MVGKDLVTSGEVGALEQLATCAASARALPPHQPLRLRLLLLLLLHIIFPSSPRRPPASAGRALLPAPLGGGSSWPRPTASRQTSCCSGSRSVEAGAVAAVAGSGAWPRPAASPSSSFRQRTMRRRGQPNGYRPAATGTYGHRGGCRPRRPGQDRQSRLLRTVSCGQEGKSLLDGLVRSACILPCAGDGRRGEGRYGLEIKVVGLHSSIRAAVVKTGDIGLAKVMESGGQKKKKTDFEAEKKMQTEILPLYKYID